MELSPVIIGIISAAIAVPVFFFVIRKIKFFSHSSNTAKDFRGLKTKYGKWETLTPIPVIVFTIVIGLAIWRFLVLLAGFRKDQLMDSEFLIYEPSTVLAFPSMSLAIMFAGFPVNYLYMHLLGPKHFAEYSEYVNRKYGVNSSRLFYSVLWVVVPVSVVFALLTLNSYVQVTAATVRINPFFSMSEKEYSFAKIEHLIYSESFKAPNGNIVHKPHFVVGFSDDFEINFGDSIHDPDIKEQVELVRYLSKKSNTSIRANELFSK